MKKANHQSRFATRSTPIWRTMAVSSVLTLSLALVSVSAHADIEKDMNSMKRSFKAAIESTTMADFSKAFSALQSSGEKAAQQSPDDLPEVYEEGMKQLKKDFETVQQAIAQGNLAEAKKALRQADSTRKKYHNKMDV